MHYLTADRSIFKFTHCFDLLYHCISVKIEWTTKFNWQFKNSKIDKRSWFHNKKHVTWTWANCLHAEWKNCSGQYLFFKIIRNFQNWLTPITERLVTIMLWVRIDIFFDWLIKTIPELHIKRSFLVQNETWLNDDQKSQMDSINRRLYSVKCIHRLSSKSTHSAWEFIWAIPVLWWQYCAFFWKFLSISLIGCVIEHTPVTWHWLIKKYLKFARRTVNGERSTECSLWVHWTADFVGEYNRQCWAFVFIHKFEPIKTHFKRLRNKNQTVCISWFLNTSYLICYISACKRRSKKNNKPNTQIKNLTPAHVELIYIICVCRCCDDHGW